MISSNFNAYLSVVQDLNLPKYPFKVISDEGTTQIFDPVRRKYLVLTPEEWVRQHFVQFLINELNYPVSLIAIEMGIKVNQLTQRCDVVIHDPQGSPWMIIECKAPHVRVSQETFDQAARYNMSLKVPYLVVTNGMQHFCCKINHSKGDFHYLKDIPTYELS